MTPLYNTFRDAFRDTSIIQARYIGGMDGHDLWLVNQSPGLPVLQVVGGEADDLWAAYAITKGKLEGVGKNDANDLTVLSLRRWVANNKEHIEHFIALFVPELVED